MLPETRILLHILRSNITLTHLLDYLAMVPSIRNDCHAAVSRAEDWQVCCARAMGYEDWILLNSPMPGDPTEPSETGDYNRATNNLHVTNLLPGDLFEEEDEDDESQQQQQFHQDPWTESALNIQADLERMSNWIQSKKRAFLSFDGMRDDEASLIQSTVTSFAATTANEIESLRKMTLTESAGNSNALNHRTGVVQILLARLKEDIVIPFGVMQKHRSRKAVSLWQNPMQCKLLVKQKAPKRKQRDEIDQALGLDDIEDDEPTEQRFLPNREAHQLRSNFLETYQQDEHLPKLPKRPTSLVRDPLSALSGESDNVKYMPASERQDLPQTLQPQRNVTSTSQQYQQLPNFSDTQEMNEAAQEQMQQEAVLLEAMAHTDLDSVQKMEQQMVSITQLLTQFSELVQEQQEEVWQIAETAKDVKDDMDEGQKQLTDAADQTYQSKNYKAKGIFAMACLLLLFHWLRP